MFFNTATFTDDSDNDDEWKRCQYIIISTGNDSEGETSQDKEEGNSDKNESNWVASWNIEEYEDKAMVSLSSKDKFVDNDDKQDGRYLHEQYRARFPCKTKDDLQHTLNFMIKQLPMPVTEHVLCEVLADLGLHKIVQKQTYPQAWFDYLTFEKLTLI